MDIKIHDADQEEVERMQPRVVLAGLLEHQLLPRIKNPFPGFKVSVLTGWGDLPIKIVGMRGLGIFAIRTRLWSYKVHPLIVAYLKKDGDEQVLHVHIRNGTGLLSVAVVEMAEKIGVERVELWYADSLDGWAKR